MESNMLLHKDNKDKFLLKLYSVFYWFQHLKHDHIKQFPSQGSRHKTQDEITPAGPTQPQAVHQK